MDLVPGILNLKMTARDQRLTQSLSKMLIGRVLTVFSLRPAREDFLGNLVVSTYYKDSAPVRIPRPSFFFRGQRVRVFDTLQHSRGVSEG